MLINLNQGCQLDCVFCRRNNFFDKENIPLFEDVLKMIVESDRGVLFSGGGEPTLDKRLPIFVKFAGKLGKQVIVETNGLAFSDMSYLARLVRSGMNDVKLTFPSHIPEVYNEVVGVPGAFGTVKKALEHLSKFKGLVTGINIPSTTVNLSFEHFTGLWNFLSDGGFGVFLNFTGFRPNNVHSVTQKYLPDYDELGKELAKIFSFCDKEGIRFSISPSTPVPFCKIKGFERRFLSELKTYYNYKSLFTHLPSCERCSMRNKCLGVSKIYLKLRKFKPEPI